MKTPVIIIILLFVMNGAFAQDTVAVKYKKSYWFDIGGGWGGEGGGLSLGLSFEHKKNRFLTLRYSDMYTDCRCQEYVLFFPVSDLPLGRDVESVEFDYGLLKKKPWGMLNFSFGLAYMKITEGTGQEDPSPGFLVGSTCPTDYKVEDNTTVGLVLRAEIMPSLRWGGLGFAPSLHISPQYTYAMFTISMSFGRLRPRNVK
jgi:hypothetical protein